MDIFKALNENSNYSGARAAADSRRLGARQHRSSASRRSRRDGRRRRGRLRQAVDLLAALLALSAPSARCAARPASATSSPSTPGATRGPRRGARARPAATDPQRFGKNAYTGLFQFAPVKEYVRAARRQVHVVEMGCGTGAGAHHVCKHVLPNCTYEAVDMQLPAIQTCRRKFVPRARRPPGRHPRRRHPGSPSKTALADFVAVCETHVTEYAGRVTDEDEALLPNRPSPPEARRVPGLGQRHPRQHLAAVLRLPRRRSA